MTEPSIWQVLGIEPTQDRAEIRRAYARRLKLTNPEDDAAGFQKLRTAYDRALAWAAMVKPATPTPVTSPVAALEPAAAESVASQTSLDLPRLRLVPEPIRREAEDAANPAPQNPSEPSGPAFVQITQPADPPPPDLRVAFGASFQKLEMLLRGPAGAEPAPLVGVLEEILASPVLQQVGAQAQAEIWLAELILRNMPHSDPLVEPVIAHFKWSGRQIGRKDAERIRHVVQRRDDLRYLADQLHFGLRDAFKVLMQPPETQTLRRRLVPFASPTDIADCLDRVQGQHSSLFANLNKDSVSFWRTYLAEPHFSALALWSFLLVPLTFLLGVPFYDRLEGWPRTAGAFGCVLVWGSASCFLVNHYLISLPRRRLKSQHRVSTSPWGQFAWALTLPGILLFSAELPSGGLVDFAVALASVPSAWYAVVTGEPDKRHGRYPWPTRMAMNQAYLVIWWYFLEQELPLDRYILMSIPIAAGTAMSCAGTMPLFRLWISQSPTRRNATLAALGGLVLLAAFLLWQQQPALRPLAAALVALAVFAHRVPAVSLGGRAMQIRHYMMWFGGVAIANLGLAQGFDLLTLGGAWLLIGVAITVAGSISWRKPA